MGTKPTHIGVRAGEADHARLRQALDVARDLQHGESVAPELVERSRQTLVDAVWSGDSATRNTADAGLQVIYDRSAEPADRAELLGELVAVGHLAKGLFQRLTHRGGSLPLSRAEWRWLADCLKQPLVERLSGVAEMLEKEGNDERSAPVAPAQSPKQSPDQESAYDRRLSMKPVDRHGQAVAAADPRFDRLADPAEPEERRLDAALAMGPAAVPLLLRLLGGEQHEFATVSLCHLGTTAEARQAVHDAAGRLAFDPSLRPTAEMIRASVEHREAGGASQGAGRRQVRDAAIGDSWLLRALSSCDSPNIMRASVGREVVAIPLAMRQLVAVRLRRGWTESPPEIA